MFFINCPIVLILLSAAFSILCAGPPQSSTAQARTAANSGNVCEAEVLTGLEVLLSERFARLEGLKLGVVTNHTGIDRQGRSIIDLIGSAENIRLEAIFSPEHGLSGKLEGAYSSSRIEEAGILVHSLYGKTRKPELKWLTGLDALVFDIQDIGTRFYTYITTMALCMESAAEAGIRFYVLDRPNPIGGLVVEGPVLEEALQGNFIAYYPIPVRHGMTVGELACLFNDRFGIGADLEVVEMQGYNRRLYYDRTGLQWIDPSPNMRSLEAALLYPGLGIAEATNLSVGRGTGIPFELYGAPYVDSARLAGVLNGAVLEGVCFHDTTFVPVSHKFKGERCGGVRAIVINRETFRSLEAGLTLLCALYKLYPDKFDLSDIDRWIGRRDVKEKIARGESVEQIMEDWREGLEEFLAVREKYLLYP